ncbi:hypothetical protein [Luteolibacter soli]|uniref:Uncharacterized protein n=1 Tax=Luteolibacter soli TaxID=3135280 RepID=A0ABU9AVI5_9BACT
MKLALALFGWIALVGCVSTPETPASSNEKGRIEMIASDIDLLRHFLDALYRSASTPYRLISDAASEQSMAHIPVADRNLELTDRLNELRRAPHPVITINVQSGDRPEPWGSGFTLYSYDTRTGKLAAVGPYKLGQDTADMWIDVRHWPGGTRLISLRFAWIHDLKDNIFHLRKDERTFRFAVADEPLME